MKNKQKQTKVVIRVNIKNKVIDFNRFVQSKNNSAQFKPKKQRVKNYNILTIVNPFYYITIF